MLRILLYLFLGILLSSCEYLENPENKSFYEKIENWQYYKEVPTADSTKYICVISMDAILETQYENVLIMETTFPDWEGNSPALYIGQIDYFLQVFHNGNLIYTIGDLEHKKFLGWNQNLIELPFFNKGDILTLRVSTEKESLGILNNVLLSSSGKIVASVFRSSFSSLIFSTLFFLIGLGIVLVNQGLFKSKLLIGIAVFITSNSFLLIGNALILQLLFKAPTLYYHMDYISLMLCTTSGFYSIEKVIYKKYKMVLEVIRKSHLAFFITSVLILNFTNITFPDLLPYYMSFLSVSMVICIIAMLLSRSVNYENKLLFIGMTSFFSFAAIEIILYFMYGLYSDLGFSVRVLYLGAICFITSLIWIVIRDYLNINKQKEIARQKEFEASKRESETRQQFAAKLLQSQDNERKRIASELHDAVGQDLLVINNLALLGLDQNKNQNDINNYLNNISETALNTIGDIRSISHNLHPYQLEKLGLEKALISIVNFVRDNSKIKFNSEIDIPDKIFPINDSIHIYRILQELLNNVIKHSNADEVSVETVTSEKKLYITVADNGLGIKNSNGEEINKNDYGFGLTGILERTTILNGDMKIKNGDPSGLRTKITIPFEKKLVDGK